MARFTLPRDLYHGKGSLEALKTFEGKRAIVCVGGGSMKRFGFLDKVEAYLKEAGITMNVETIDAGIWSSARAAGELQATVLGWFPLYADADNQMYTYYYSENAVGKGVFYNNPEFDSLMKEARESNDSDKRVELYKKADYILSREDYGTIPLYYGKLQFVAKPYVKNAKLGNLIYHLYNIDIDLSKK